MNHSISAGPLDEANLERSWLLLLLLPPLVACHPRPTAAPTPTPTATPAPATARVVDFSAYLDTLQRHRVWRVVEASDAPARGEAFETLLGWEIRYPPGDPEVARQQICATLDEDHDLLAQAPARAFRESGEDRSYGFALHCGLEVNQPALLAAARAACPTAAVLDAEGAFLAAQVYRSGEDVAPLGWERLRVVERVALHHDLPGSDGRFRDIYSDRDARVYWGGMYFDEEGRPQNVMARRDLDGSVMFWDVAPGWHPDETHGFRTIPPALDEEGGVYRAAYTNSTEPDANRRVAYFDPVSGERSILEPQWPTTHVVNWASYGTVIDGLLVVTQDAELERQGALFVVDVWGGGPARRVPLPPPTSQARYVEAREVWRTTEPGVVAWKGFERDRYRDENGGELLVYRLVTMRFDVHDEVFTPVGLSWSPYTRAIQLGVTAEGELLVAHRVPDGGAGGMDPQQWLLGVQSPQTGQVRYSHRHCLDKRPGRWVVAMGAGLVVTYERDDVRVWEEWGPPQAAATE